MRALISVMTIALLAMVANVQADEYEAGVHYVELPAQAPTQHEDKVEVTELFWYGCGGCNALEPLINAWYPDLPEDAYFRRVPALFGGTWNTHGQLYYTLESLGKLDEAHDAVFHALHQDGRRMTEQSEILDVLEPYDIDADAFEKAWNSFGVNSKMSQAQQLARTYRATGVPTLIINGKYVIQNNATSGFEEVLKIADYLVDMEREAL
ncbi:thiol:disulfide interchange protein DsbA/DsbL [Halopseudomonas salegens]|uniref:Thiol:disulfide interchange protein n=1 Tax=Halopseudomonas salegens TaxID=1434072 RepID=A0A1H2HWM8_9GAMM|nr:thiol:disulfide interchange protein DsbA/DsbL [Halopseudomonas salegens]SDU36267.1 Thiol:disulfide interchange protein DsbA [Halopseudomonas salegens]